MVTQTGLKVRMAVVGALLFGLYLWVAQLFLSAGVDLLWVLVGLGGFVALQYKVGRWMALRSVNARELTPAEYPDIHRSVDDLCRSMDLQKPRLMIASMGTPNAFAVGRRGAGVVVLSESLLEILEPEEVEGVVAHELAHIDNRDVVMMVLGQAIAAVVGFLVFLGVRVAGRRSLIITIVAWVLGTVAQFLVTLLVLALSRYREYVADETAARHTGRPEALASALSKITVLGRSEATQEVDDSVNALCISGGAASLLSTHPSVDKRIQRLAPGFDPAVAVEELEAKFQPEAVCPDCGTAVDPTWSFCDDCGASLESVAAPDASRGGETRADNRSAGTAAADNPTQNPPAPQSERTVCPGCGTRVEPSWQYCEACGQPLSRR